MPDYLDADCVMSALFDKGLFTRKEWRLPKATEEYSIFLEFESSAKIAGFNIYIIGSRQCVGTAALKNQSVRFNIPIVDIVKQCRFAE
jgi:hypothetical protein